MLENYPIIFIFYFIYVNVTFFYTIYHVIQPFSDEKYSSRSEWDIEFPPNTRKLNTFHIFIFRNFFGIPYRMEPIRTTNIHLICVVKHAAKTSYLYGNHIHKDKIQILNNINIKHRKI